jgi:hypothetical protein
MPVEPPVSGRPVATPAPVTRTVHVTCNSQDVCGNMSGFPGSIVRPVDKVEKGSGGRSDCNYETGWPYAVVLRRYYEDDCLGPSMKSHEFFHQLQMATCCRLYCCCWNEDRPDYEEHRRDCMQAWNDWGAPPNFSEWDEEAGFYAGPSAGECGAYRWQLFVIRLQMAQLGCPDTHDRAPRNANGRAGGADMLDCCAQLRDYAAKIRDEIIPKLCAGLASLELTPCPFVERRAGV